MKESNALFSVHQSAFPLDLICLSCQKCILTGRIFHRYGIALTQYVAPKLVDCCVNDLWYFVAKQAKVFPIHCTHGIAITFNDSAFGQYLSFIGDLGSIFVGTNPSLPKRRRNLFHLHILIRSSSRSPWPSSQHGRS